MNHSSQFWDLLAPHHAAVENSYLDLSSIRQIVGALEPPILVVGAGQGLIVSELQRRGLHCDGVDSSSKMIQYAKSRRGLTIVEADAGAMPFGEGTYRTIVYATGVVDFMGDEVAISQMLKEGRRVLNPSGKIFVAFYKVSRALEEFMTRVGLLDNGVIAHRKSLELYVLSPAQMVNWVSERAGIGRMAALILLLRTSMRSKWHEKAITFRMQNIFRDRHYGGALILAAPETQPYRNEALIRALFQRLGIAVQELHMTTSCYLVRIGARR